MIEGEDGTSPGPKRNGCRFLGRLTSLGDGPRLAQLDFELNDVVLMTGEV